MKEDIQISVVIPTYNHSQYLRRCLDSLFQQNYPVHKYEVIVINDASEDDTQEVLDRYRKKNPNLHVIMNLENRGAYYSRNRGIDVAKGNIVVFTDSDCILPSNWLQKIEKEFCDPTVLCVQGTQKNGGRWGNSLVEGEGLIKDLKRLERLDTKNLMIRRHLIQYHKFDENLRGSGDIDFAINLKKAGINVKYSNDIFVIHLVENFGEVLARAKAWGRGQASLYRKYGYGGGKHVNPKLGRSLAFNFLFYSAAFFFFLLKSKDFKGAFGRSVLRFLMAFYFQKEIKRMGLK